MASDKYIKIVGKDNRVHILPDKRQNRAFHERYTKNAQAADRYKSIDLVSGTYVIDTSTGEMEFKETEFIENIFKNLSPEDGKVAAFEAENDALKAQIEALNAQLADNALLPEKKKPGRKKKEDTDEAGEPDDTNQGQE